MGVLALSGAQPFAFVCAPLWKNRHRDPSNQQLAKCELKVVGPFGECVLQGSLYASLLNITPPIYAQHELARKILLEPTQTGNIGNTGVNVVGPFGKNCLGIHAHVGSLFKAQVARG